MTRHEHELEDALLRRAEIVLRLEELGTRVDLPTSAWAEVHADFLAREWGDDSPRVGVLVENAVHDLGVVDREISRLRDLIAAEAARDAAREAAWAAAEAARAAEAEALEVARHGRIRDEGLLSGTSSFPRDEVLLDLIEADPGADAMLASLREALEVPGADAYRAIRDVTNDLGGSRMSDGANWRPDTVSRVARAVGVGRYVSALVGRLRSRM